MTAFVPAPARSVGLYIAQARQALLHLVMGSGGGGGGGGSIPAECSGRKHQRASQESPPSPASQVFLRSNRVSAGRLPRPCACRSGILGAQGRELVESESPAVLGTTQEVRAGGTPSSTHPSAGTPLERLRLRRHPPQAQCSNRKVFQKGAGGWGSLSLPRSSPG